MAGFSEINNVIYVQEFGAVAKKVTTSSDIIELDPSGYGGVQVINLSLLTIAIHGVLAPTYNYPLTEEETIFRRLVIHNGSGDDLSTITIKHNSSSASEGARFDTVSGADVILPRKGLITFGYVVSDSFSGWRQG